MNTIRRVSRQVTQEEIDHLQVMQHIETCNSQQELAHTVGFSVGKVNYVIKALLEKGYVKMNKFVKAKNKRAYSYLLTKEGLKKKIRLTEAFIEIKKHEYETLQETLKQDKERI
ncbi:MarR family EPS-associated transcriptional regulator [Sulfurovum sp. zt1-1]|uniref:MarR family EPS-associated transcriptional regulator n=1 Tax=Sulfurovum zhangzhouensis TaxID=3019067 RepID=A0ABT7R004_9BACT|nr:MarR family EPS-associated transcriptional regulator [Sulfurovum zhangzhouensis]MDM5272410.1 MarR family EPS-associated transcriptional regulator [Sulfurovum zhangzhouensis]